MEKIYSTFRNEAEITSRIRIHKGKVESFCISVAYVENGRRVTAYRADTSHGCLHEHRFWESGEPRRMEEVYLDYGMAFNLIHRIAKERAEEWIGKMRRKNGP